MMRENNYIYLGITAVCIIWGLVSLMMGAVDIAIFWMLFWIASAIDMRIGN